MATRGAVVAAAAEPRVFRSDAKRNRDAVVDALLALFREGNLAPSSAEVAERAGISARSLFRYFADVDDLCGAAIDRHQAAMAPLLDVDVAADAPLAARIEALVEQRQRLFEAVGEVGAVSRLRAPFQPLLAAQLTRGRAYLRGQARRVFERELAALGAERGSAALAAIDVLCSYESYQLLRHDQSLSRPRIAAALTAALTALLREVP